MLSLLQALKFAKALGREQEFAKEQKFPGFEAAFGNWHVALWRWAWRLTPDSVFDRLDAAEYSVPDTPETKAKGWQLHHDYILWRAVFVAGMKAGEGFKAAHYRHFAYYARFADQLEDAEVFELAKQHPHHGSTAKDFAEKNRKLKYRLLIAWLPCGLWHRQKRAEQLDALYSQWRDMPRYNDEAVTIAEKGLGLRRLLT